MAGETNPEEYVRLVSGDGLEFVLPRRCALVSGTIKSMLCGPGAFSERGGGSGGGGGSARIVFQELSGAVLERVCEYFHYRVRYANEPEPIPDFPIEKEMALELLMAANFLDT
jgi:transcription elongation factor B subunit 1